MYLKFIFLDQFLFELSCKFEANIPNCSKVIAFTRNSKFQGQFDLEGLGQGHQFSNISETIRCLINLTVQVGR